jgi:hypothetical protein
MSISVVSIPSARAFFLGPGGTCTAFGFVLDDGNVVPTNTGCGVEMKGVANSGIRTFSTVVSAGIGQDIAIDNLHNIVEYTVNPNGGADFTTLADAIIALNLTTFASPPNELKILYLWPGIYTSTGGALTAYSVAIIGLTDEENESKKVVIEDELVIAQAPTFGISPRLDMRIFLQNLSFEGVGSVLFATSSLISIDRCYFDTTGPFAINVVSVAGATPRINIRNTFIRGDNVPVQVGGDATGIVMDVEKTTIIAPATNLAITGGTMMRMFLRMRDCSSDGVEIPVSDGVTLIRSRLLQGIRFATLSVPINITCCQIGGLRIENVGVTLISVDVTITDTVIDSSTSSLHTSSIINASDLTIDHCKIVDNLDITDVSLVSGPLRIRNSTCANVINVAATPLVNISISNSEFETLSVSPSPRRIDLLIVESNIAELIAAIRERALFIDNTEIRNVTTLSGDTLTRCQIKNSYLNGSGTSFSLLDTPNIHIADSSILFAIANASSLILDGTSTILAERSSFRNSIANPTSVAFASCEMRGNSLPGQTPYLFYDCTFQGPIRKVGFPGEAHFTGGSVQHDRSANSPFVFDIIDSSAATMNAIYATNMAIYFNAPANTEYVGDSSGGPNGNNAFHRAGLSFIFNTLAESNTVAFYTGQAPITAS